MKKVIAIAPSSQDLVPFRGEAEFRDAFDERLRELFELRFLPLDSPPESVSDAEILVLGHVDPRVAAAARNARWLNFWTAGLDINSIAPFVERGVRVTHSSGVHAPKIAAHVMACILMFACRMPFFMEAQRERAWKQEPAGYDDLTGKTLAIAGLGRIGEALAVRAHSFGMRVVASKRDTSVRYDPSVVIDRMYTPEELPAMLNEADHVCIALRLTPETDRLFDAAMLAQMKPTAYLYSVARGRIVDEGALIAALNRQVIQGAALDVFESEPLAAESPLWAMKNVIITPHVAGFNPHYFERAAQQFAANVHRYLSGEPLHNAYDPRRGY
jgi:phosphoglycerate dehydrogenase-like enzyme